MHKVFAGLLGVALVSGAAVALPTAAAAAPGPGTAAREEAPRPADDLPNPLGKKRRELREQAVAGLLDGTVKTRRRGASTVAKLGRTMGAGETDRAIPAAGQDQYVELGREATDRVFVILAEFGDERHPDYPDADSDPAIPGPVVFDGPLHNAIAAPDRTVDNRTKWQADYSREHYQQLLFGTGAGVESLKTYYETQSSGRYSVDGTVTDWVKVRYNEARYGRTCAEGCVQGSVWSLVADAADQWAADQKAAGRTPAQIRADLQSFDVHDRYDFDGDGNFNEADGYLDHFQIVHAGADEADGASPQGEDAIWAQRAYAYPSDGGPDTPGPAGNPAGGTQIGDTGIWIGDFIVQPENGGLSVFAHEFGHDLDLPDDYDTIGGSNSNTEFWSLMDQSRLGGEGEPVGSRAGDLGAWNKLQLGWLKFEVVQAGDKRTIALGPEEYNSEKPQAAVVVLPDKTVVQELGAPFAGTGQYFSGNADNLDTTSTRAVDLTGATTAALTLQGRYAVEQGYDFLYVEGSDDGGKTWTALDGTAGGVPFGRDGSGRPAIGGSTEGAWVAINVPLTAYAGSTPSIRFHYRTDGSDAKGGFFADDVAVTADGATVFTDGAESAPTFKLAGFTVRGSSISQTSPQFYIAGNRSHVSYDRYLKTGPYNYGFASTRPNWAEHFAYQQGLLISYWDLSFSDNNVNVHPGQGRNLYVDARPEPMYNLDGKPWRSRIQLYDAPFGLQQADSFTLHVDGRPSQIQGRAAQPEFDDTRQYFYQDTFWAGVKLPATGVKIKVLEQAGTSMKIQIS